MRQRRAPTGEQPLAGSLSMMKPCPSHSAASSFRSARKPRISSFLMRPATSFGSPISTAAAPSCLSSTSWTQPPADASNYVSCGTTGRPSRSTASHCSALIPGARAAIKSSKALTSFRFPCWLTREERLLLATVRAGFLSNGRSTVSGSTGEFGLRSGACRLPRGSWGPSRTRQSTSPLSDGDPRSPLRAGGPRHRATGCHGPGLDFWPARPSSRGDGAGLCCALTSELRLREELCLRAERD